MIHDVPWPAMGVSALDLKRVLRRRAAGEVALGRPETRVR
jgi:hypothetical protein